MNPTAIYSKSGKGVQEASGKTSLLKRPDRAVLSAIDGRATLADVAQKVGKAFDAEFQKLVTQLDKDGFIREVSPGATAAKPAGPAAKAPPKPAAPSAPMDGAPDLDFSMIAPAPKPAAPAAPVAKAPPPKEQQAALNKAREEAEEKAQAERDRIKAETEAKMRAELEATARVEAEAKIKAEAASKSKSDSEAKVRAEAEAKIKAARDAAVRTAVDAKTKADAETRRVREEAERGRKELDEERKAEEERTARRKREEEEEKARREQREEEERKAEEERAERRKREEEEEKARQTKKEEERKRREEDERKAEEERAERRKREEEEEERRAEEERSARRKKREEEEARAREEEEEQAKRRKREQDEARQRRAEEEETERQRLAAEEDDRRKSSAQKSIAELQTAKPAAPAAPKAGGGFDSLLADLDSFGKKDDEAAKAGEEAERKAKEAAARRAQEEALREREEEERRAAEERAARRKREAEEEELKAEEERSARRKKREEEDRREADERKVEEKKRKDSEEAAEAKRSKGKKAKAGAEDDIPVSDDDLGMDDVKRDQRALAGKKKEKAYVAPPPVALSTRRRPTNWGKPVAMGLILLLAVAVGVVHVLPLSTAEYERAASEAIGRPVKIASGRIWLFTGLQLKLQGVTVGDNVKIANVMAYPTIDTLSGDKKTFSRIDLEGVVLPQQALGEALFAKVKGDKFTVARVVVKQLELTGPMPLPKGLEADIALDADGALRTITVRGPDTLVAKLTPKDSAIEFEVSAGGFIIPIAPEMTLGNFAMKGTASRQGLAVSEWDGALLNGTLRGTANVRWGSTWTANGVITARGINAAVFAPALVSEGRGEGTAKFTMSGPEPAKLGSSGRYDGSFKVEAGALGSVDLSLALKTGGRQTAGRTPFNDLTGQVTYERGTVSARNIQLGSGALNAGASADITREGALSGRIVADVRVGSQTLRATLNMSGTAKDPQFRN